MSELRDRNGREEVETIAQSKMHVALSPRVAFPGLQPLALQLVKLSMGTRSKCC